MKKVLTMVLNDAGWYIVQYDQQESYVKITARKEGVERYVKACDMDTILDAFGIVSINNYENQ